MRARRSGAILRLGVKELRSVWHDKVLLFFVLWTFSFGIYSAATSMSRELHNAAIAVVDEDRSPLSARISAAFYGPYFKPPAHIGLADVDRGLDTGRYTFVLDVPPNFQRDVQAGRRPTIQVNIDATQMSQAFIGASYIQNIVMAEIEEFVGRRRASAAAPASVVVRVMFNPNLNGVWFGGVMKIIDNITMLSVILAGAALIREREHGTLEHLLVMPLTPFQIMAAKIWANGLVVLCAAGLSLWLVVRGALGVPIAGSVLLFLGGAALNLI
jgi:ABC-2 type transport system permease protein